MALDTFAPAIAPSYGSPKRVKPRLLLTSFGEGYRQAAPDGLNWMVDEYTLNWTALRVADADAIEAFLIAHADATPFWWTPVRAASPVKFQIFQGWERTPGNKPWDRLSVVFEQSFDLST